MQFQLDSTAKLSRFFKDQKAILRPNLNAADDTTDRLSDRITGSWFVQFLPLTPAAGLAVRGPVRIDGPVANPRISGDIYVGADTNSVSSGGSVETMPDNSLVIGENWYPAFPQSQYSWYFRGVEATVDGDELQAVIERHVWDPALSRFVQTDMGGIILTLQSAPVAWPNLPKPAPIMSGEALIAGETVRVVAIKTSEYYRGCIVEVDVMENRRWPDSASDAFGTRSFTFDSIFRDAGLDFATRISDIDIPDDATLSPLELNTLLSTHREPTSMADAWRLWLLIGSSWQANPGVLGIMFDSTPPHREGTVGFFDPRLSASPIIQEDARGKKLGEVDLAFLRTLVHEAGHAFNLFHPKDDAHTVQVDTTIMNQTGDVLGFATPARPYPSNASMHFNEHNLASLIHGPDPQTKPGWLPFGWGHHSSISTGIEEPTGLFGLNSGNLVDKDLDLDLDLPREIHRGEVVVANLTLRNLSGQELEVSNALNIAQDDLEIVAISPDGKKLLPRDVVKVCGAGDVISLAPSDVIVNAVQLFFNNGGFTFSQVGVYQVWARFRPYENPRVFVESARITVNVRNSVTRKEQELETMMLDEDVGLGVAFGDFGANAKVEKTMKKVAERYEGTDTGLICAMVSSNSLAKPHMNARTGEICRAADEDLAGSILDSALAQLSSEKAFRLSMATVTPRDARAPLLQLLETKMGKRDGENQGDGGSTLTMLRKLGMRA